MNDIDKLVLVYRSESGEEFRQPATDLVQCGTLLDPETDEDLELVGWEVAS